MLPVTILCIAGVRSSQWCFKNQAGILSIPVAFFGLRCFRQERTCPKEGSGGDVSLSKWLTSFMSGRSTLISFHGFVKAVCRFSATFDRSSLDGVCSPAGYFPFIYSHVATA